MRYNITQVLVYSIHRYFILLLHSTTTPLHYYTTALLHHSTTTPLHYYTTALLHHSTTAPLHYYTTALHQFLNLWMHACTTCTTTGWMGSKDSQLKRYLTHYHELGFDTLSFAVGPKVIHIHTYTHTHIHIHTHTYTHTYTYTHTHTHTHTYTHIHTYTHTHTHIYTRAS